jgi:hypothetical protein
VNDPGSGCADEPAGRAAREHVGTAERRPVGGRSKSERDALVLVFDDGSAVVLRRRDGPALGDDPALASLEGRRLKVRGTRTETALLADSWEALA